MTKKPTTEELLERGRGISLSDSERAGMKAKLLSYARYHGVQQPPEPTPSWSAHLFRYGVAGAALTLVLFIGTGYAATSSLPGETLYAVKTDVIEELVGLTMVSEPAQVAYRQDLLKRRLAEVQQVQGIAAPAALASVGAEVSELVSEVKAILEGDTDGSLSGADSIAITSSIIALTETLEEEVHGSESEEIYESILDTAEDLHQDEIEAFINGSSTSTIESYLAEQLTELETALSEGLAATTSEQVTGYLIETEAAISEAAYEEAVLNLTEAVRQVSEAELDEVND